MSSLNEIRKSRIKKLENLKRAGISPYPEKSRRDLEIAQALQKFASLARQKKKVILGGRVRGLRIQGGLIFVDLEDQSGTLQLVLRKNILGEEQFKTLRENLDIGDFLEAGGVLFKTKAGQKSLDAGAVRLLVKSLRPLPQEWYGLKDIEERFRKRYLDLLMNEDVRKRFLLRSKIIQEVENYLENKGFLKVATPILQPLYGGAAARPFKTHFNALNLDLYLRIAPELYLKRLLVGGFEKIYEIGRCFRNEGLDREHNPEFTILELYWAWQGYEDLMKFTEALFVDILKKIFGQTKLSYGGKSINFKKHWCRADITKLVKEKTGIDFQKDSEKEIEKKVKKLDIDIGKEAKGIALIDPVFKKACAPKIWQPTFVCGHPIEISPLAKKDEKNPSRALRFQLIVGGMEIVNGFSELNDPLEQVRRFELQEKSYKRGDSEAFRLDKEFIEALEYGMPPAAGLGLGIERLVMLFTDAPSIREAIFFPTMRPK